MHVPVDSPWLLVQSEQSNDLSLCCGSRMLHYQDGIVQSAVTAPAVADQLPTGSNDLGVFCRLVFKE